MINGTFARIPLSPKWVLYLDKVAARARQSTLDRTALSRAGWEKRRANMKAQQERSSV